MKIIDELYVRYPQLEGCRGEIEKAFDILLACYRAGGKVLVCGNGGSASDSEHIVGELMKKFRKHRDIDAALAAKLPPELAAKLEGALPAVSLVSMSGILTAFANDVAWETAFAQQVVGLGRPGDVLIALSTSGNSANCVNAALVAKAKGMKVVSLTGAGGGKLGAVADASLAMPETETYKIQELHLPVYHALCAALEEELFSISSPASSSCNVE
jgi:phosphoheptose isomerase